MFATRLQPRLNMFSCEIYLQKQCKLFLSFALSLLLFLCDCGALSSQRKKETLAWRIRPISYINMVAWLYKKLRVHAIFVQLSRDYICCHRIYDGGINFVAVAKQIMQRTEKNSKLRKNLSFGLPLPNLLTSSLGNLLPLASWCWKEVVFLQLSTVQLNNCLSRM